MDTTDQLSTAPGTVRAYPDWRKRMAKNYAPPRYSQWGPMLPYTYTVPASVYPPAPPTL